jgi:hypothetical protein
LTPDETVSLSVTQNLVMVATLWTETNDYPSPLSLSSLSLSPLSLSHSVSFSLTLKWLK